MIRLAMSPLAANLPPHRARPAEAGIVLVTSLLLLLVVTIMALSMFRSFGLQERIAGNVREKQRASQAAASTQEYAEWWLTTQSRAVFAIENGYAAAAAITCSTALLDADVNGDIGANAGQICSNTLPTLAGVAVTAWPTSGSTVGVAYTPPGMNVSNSSAANYYYEKPRFYITDLGPVATGRGEVYQVDAFSYGLSSTAVSVVESTVAITCLVCNLGGL